MANANGSSGKRLDACLVTRFTDRDGKEGSRWLNIGVAFTNRLGGWNVKADHPLTLIPGVSELVLCEPRERDTNLGGRAGGGDEGMSWE